MAPANDWSRPNRWMSIRWGLEWTEQVTKLRLVTGVDRAGDRGRLIFGITDL